MLFRSVGARGGSGTGDGRAAIPLLLMPSASASTGSWATGTTSAGGVGAREGSRIERGSPMMEGWQAVGMGDAATWTLSTELAGVKAWRGNLAEPPDEPNKEDAGEDTDDAEAVGSLDCAKPLKPTVGTLGDGERCWTMGEAGTTEIGRAHV